MSSSFNDRGIEFPRRTLLLRHVVLLCADFCARMFSSLQIYSYYRGAAIYEYMAVHAKLQYAISKGCYCMRFRACLRLLFLPNGEVTAPQ